MNFDASHPVKMAKCSVMQTPSSSVVKSEASKDCSGKLMFATPVNNQVISKKKEFINLCDSDDENELCAQPSTKEEKSTNKRQREIIYLGPKKNRRTR